MRLPERLLTLLASILAAGSLWAGGSGLNVIVVVNQNSTNSVRLGSDYCELRGVPPQNVLRMTGWTGGAIIWSRAEFETRLRNPLLAMLSDRRLTNQADLVLLSMDIPYRILDPDQSQNSTTSALFYGFKHDVAPPLTCLPSSCSLPDSSSNSYAFSELPLREAPPGTAPTNSFLAMMLTSSNLATADLILSRGVASDSSFPTQTIHLERTGDPARSVRYVEFDNAILASRVRGDNSLVWTNSSSTSFTSSLGLLTGLANLTLPANAFVRGAIGDSLTSYAGRIFENSGQTSLLAFLNAGAAGSYGAVVEPCNYTQKFPDPLDYFYQARGFCLAEAYYQSLRNPYQGLMAGEPLSAPFARRGTGDWSSLTNGTILAGPAALSPVFSAGATNLPLGRVDLFVDGSFLQTLTNLPPSAGNALSVTLNGFTVNYTVPTNATVASAVAGLAAALNAETNFTGVQAWPVGDRIELQALDVAGPGSNVTLSADSAIGSADRLTTWLAPARPTFLDATATGYLGVLAAYAPAVGDWLQLVFTKTNGAEVVIGVTNLTAGTTIGTLTRNLFNSVNANPALLGADGVLATDVGDLTETNCANYIAAQFTINARSAGGPASRIQVAFTASTNLLALPFGTNALQDNINDLRLRNHLYTSSGSFSLPVNSLLDTTQLADGYHQLTAVAYEGTSVRTQTPVSRTVRIQNTALTAAFAALLAGTNATIEMPLKFSVTASATNISRIELFSTGGSVGVVSNHSAAVFTAPSAMLGLGLHPFYALVTDTSGSGYQTQTAWIRLVPAFKLSISGTPLKLSWAAIPGQSYDVLATTNPAGVFYPVASVIATNALAQWPVSAPGGAAAFYRVQISP